MTTTQLFFAIAGMNITLCVAFGTFAKYYVDAKIDPIAADVKRVIDYLILFECLDVLDEVHDGAPEAVERGEDRAAGRAH